MQDPVVVTYGLARLGAIACSADRETGARFIEEAHRKLVDLAPEAFDSSATPLPASSFTVLRNVVLESAKTCGSGEQIVDDRAINQRLIGEWRKSNVWLNVALKTKDHDRAAQLIEASMEVSNHGSQLRTKALAYNRSSDKVHILIARDILDLVLFVKALAKLRTEAPGLADEVFHKAVRMVNAASPPTAAEYAQLAVYLFPTDRQIQLPIDDRIQIEPPGGLPMPNFAAADLRGTFDVASAFLQDATTVIQRYETVEADPLDVYGLAYGMLPVVEKYAPELAGAWKTAALNVESKLGSKAAEIREDFGPLPKEDPYEAAASDLVTAGRALVELGRENFQGAHARATRIADEGARDRLDKLVTFEGTAKSFTIGRPIDPDDGARRALLYASAAAALAGQDASRPVLQLALDELTALSAVERSCILPALMPSATALDDNLAVAILRLLVKAVNETDGTQLVGRCSEAGLEEDLALRDGTVPFVLRVPRISGYSVRSALVRMKNVGFSRLEPVVSQLKDETRRVEALLALAEMETGAGR